MLDALLTGVLFVRFAQASLIRGGKHFPMMKPLPTFWVKHLVCLSLGFALSLGNDFIRAWVAIAFERPAVQIVSYPLKLRCLPVLFLATIEFFDLRHVMLQSG